MDPGFRRDDRPLSLREGAAQALATSENPPLIGGLGRVGIQSNRHIGVQREQAAVKTCELATVVTRECGEIVGPAKPRHLA